MVLQPLLGSAELLSYIRTNETILSLVSSTCLLRNISSPLLDGRLDRLRDSPRRLLRTPSVGVHLVPGVVELLEVELDDFDNLRLLDPCEIVFLMSIDIPYSGVEVKCRSASFFLGL